MCEVLKICVCTRVSDARHKSRIEEIIVGDGETIQGKSSLINNALLCYTDCFKCKYKHHKGLKKVRQKV